MRMCKQLLKYVPDLNTSCDSAGVVDIKIQKSWGIPLVSIFPWGSFGYAVESLFKEPCSTVSILLSRQTSGQLWT
jgi:hypothetical protein